MVGRQAVLPVHSHIQRCVGHIGKAAAAVIQLRRGNAQIEQHAVDFIQSQIIQNGSDLGEIAVYQSDPIHPRGQPLLCRFQRHRITVHADEPTGGQPLYDLAGMTGSAQCAVQIDSIGLDVQGVNALPQEYGAMYKFHQKSSSSITAARFSGVRVSASRRS